MGALPNGTTQQDFYSDPSLQGNYQYVSLKDIVNNFLLIKVGDTNHIKLVERDVVIYHGKRGIQELTYDSTKEIKGQEITLSDNLTLILPEDYVKYVRVSWIDEAGNFHPMIVNNDTIISASYLQDNQYGIIFDAEGSVLTATSNTYDPAVLKNSSSYNYYGENGCNDYFERQGSRFGLQTDKANSNGWFTVDKRSGVMKFSSNVGTRTIVLEYISDGIEYASLSDIKIHKFAEDALMKWIEASIIENIDKIPEYVVKRKKKDAHLAKNKAKIRLSGFNYEELLQTLRGRDKRLK